MCHGEERMTGHFLEKQLKRGGGLWGEAEQTDGSGIYFVEGRHKIFPKEWDWDEVKEKLREADRRLNMTAWYFCYSTVFLSVCLSFSITFKIAVTVLIWYSASIWRAQIGISLAGVTHTACWCWCSRGDHPAAGEEEKTTLWFNHWKTVKVRTYRI